MCIHKNINWVDAVADIFIKLTNLFGWTLPWRMSTENLYVNLKGSNANYVWYSPGHCQGDYHGDISAHWQIRPRARAILLTLIVVGSARTIDFPHQHYSVPTPMSQSYEQLENDFCFFQFPIQYQSTDWEQRRGWVITDHRHFRLSQDISKTAPYTFSHAFCLASFMLILKTD